MELADERGGLRDQSALPGAPGRSGGVVHRGHGVVRVARLLVVAERTDPCRGRLACTKATEDQEHIPPESQEYRMCVVGRRE
ncbi:hypothetical protein GCM10023235_59460 [Kitasatospora terrestris]|uniref:Uncharacterized protein n=1 Tax=Kitasatospora terrestris TaxID=258051 RepID=A0ABP9ECB8_9ACTN